tara:strand:- start:588 stop:776 length:189 start_codon:yes stop_codon:yes gene_type:complete
MINENNQLEIRKFLKRLGINSQQELNKFIESNSSVENFNISVNFQINDQDVFKFEDKLKIVK